MSKPVRVVGNLKDLDLLEARRRELVEAATEVFAAKGYDRASVNEIAERCHWSIGALYRYVKTKDDILYLVCEEIFRHIGPAVLDSLPTEDPAGRFRTAFTLYWDNCAARRKQVLLMYREYGRLSPPARRRFQDLELDVTRVFEQIVTDGVTADVFVCESPRTFAVECVLLGHSIPLKSWALPGTDHVLERDNVLAWLLRALHRI